MCVCVYVCVVRGQHPAVGSFLLRHVGPRDWSQVIRLSDKHLDLLSRLTVSSSSLRIGYLVSFLVTVIKCLTRSNLRENRFTVAYSSKRYSLSP